MEPLNKSTAALSGSLAATFRFENLEIHKVFLRFSNLDLRQNLSLTALTDLFRVTIEFDKKLSSLFIAPKVRQILRKTAHHTGFLMKSFYQKSLLHAISFERKTSNHTLKWIAAFVTQARLKSSNNLLSTIREAEEP